MRVPVGGHGFADKFIPEIARTVSFCQSALVGTGGDAHTAGGGADFPATIPHWYRSSPGGCQSFDGRALLNSTRTRRWMAGGIVSILLVALSWSLVSWKPDVDAVGARSLSEGARLRFETSPRDFGDSGQSPSSDRACVAPNEFEEAREEISESDTLAQPIAMKFLVQRVDGTPVPFVRLHLFHRLRTGTSVEHVFDGDRGGRVTCSGSFGQEPVEVVALADGLGSTGRVTITSIPPQDEPVLLTLRPFAWIRGRVTDSSGRVAVDVAVEVEIVGVLLGSPMPRAPQRSKTDSSGSFTVQVDGVGGDYMVRAGSPPAGAATTRLSLAVDESCELALRLTSTMVVEGRVVGPEGHGVAGASIVVERLLTGDDPEEKWQYLPTLTSDDRGYFSWSVTEPMVVGMYAVSSDLAASSEVRLDLSNWRSAPFALLQLREPEAICGRVTWSDGTPVADAEIVAQSVLAHDSRSASRREAVRHGLPKGKTDHEGRFRVAPTSPGAVYALATAPMLGRPECIARFSPVESGAPSVDWIVDPERYCGLSVQARVVLEDSGQALANPIVDVHVRRNGAWELLRQLQFSDLDGWFEFGGLVSDSEYALTVANAAGYMPVVLGPFRAANMREPVTLVMLRPRTIHVNLHIPGDLDGAKAYISCTAVDDHPGRLGFLAYPVDSHSRSKFYLWPGDYTFDLVCGERRLSLGSHSVPNLPLEQLLHLEARE